MRVDQIIRYLAVPILGLAWMLPVEAQDGNEAPPDEAAAAGGDAEATERAVLEGDTIHLTSGTVMSGVQVLRSTPRYYLVEVVPGAEPMQIPRRQVDFVEYDDTDPGLEDLRKELFGDSEEVVEIAPGEQVTGLLRDKLLAPAFPEGANYRNKDFVEILEELRVAREVELRVDKSIRDRDATKRLWTVEIPADRTLMSLLREDLTGQFGFVAVLFETDHILVITKAAANQRQQNQPEDGETP